MAIARQIVRLVPVDVRATMAGHRGGRGGLHDEQDVGGQSGARSPRLGQQQQEQRCGAESLRGPREGGWQPARVGARHQAIDARGLGSC